MNETQKKVAAYIRREGAREACERDENGRVILNMTVKNDDGFLSVYSSTDTPVISAEVADFIENKTKSILPTEPLALHIHSDCIDEDEKELYKKAVKEYYVEHAVENERELRRNHVIVALLALTGVLILALSFLIGHAIWAEVIDIVAWVLLWEAVDVAVFRNRDRRVARLRYIAEVDMDIRFFPLTKEK